MAFDGFSKIYRVTDRYSIRLSTDADCTAIVCRWLPTEPVGGLNDAGYLAFDRAHDQFLAELEHLTGERWHTREGMQRPLQ